jgi:hypothetical protein
VNGVIVIIRKVIGLHCGKNPELQNIVKIGVNITERLYTKAGP